MTPCPICQRPTPDANIVRHPYIHGQALALTLKINPDWQHSDGACRTCVESIIDTGNGPPECPVLGECAAEVEESRYLNELRNVVTCRRRQNRC